MKYRYNKKRIALVVLVVFALIFCIFALNKKDYEPVVETVAPTEVVTRAKKTVPQITSPECKTALLYCVNTGEILYAQNTDARIATASLVKLVTASVALEYFNSDEVFTVGTERNLVLPYSSLCYIEIGQRLTLKDLLCGLLVSSGNDAAYTIAAQCARKLEPDADMTDAEAVELFCGRMNLLAEKLGMEHSGFVNPDGMDEDGQYTTAADLVKIAKYALSFPEIREIVGSHSVDVTFVSGETMSWTSTNRMLDPSDEFYNKNVFGMKTGTTSGAGTCLIASFYADNKMYISVVSGCELDRDRYEITSKLISAVS